MRINRIKLAGFKSFVDPTSISVPGNLTGIVGPNGCGKSNIIDALMWVMGESSAKHLRGDSMADVIFNGSNTRKPVSQAMTEIIFDNSDGTLGGQYAGFGEISVKRTIARDGISSYFLNGARCRRKDITNVFLGTGIGARGYSIIEQGTISRVIEAKPEELRAFLEEAAGISKYKERRRETETRMRHANENIERLTDIRDELGKQLSHLQRQARAAERYQLLKTDERRLNARGLAVRWRALDTDRQRSQRDAEQRATELEAEVARLRSVEAEQVAAREAHNGATESFNAVQSEFYAHSADISRLEQALKHADEREQSLARDLEAGRRTQDELTRGMAIDATQLESSVARMREVEPQLARLQGDAQASAETMKAVEVRLEQWQHEWDAFNRQHTTLAQREHGAQVRLEALLSALAAAENRTRALDAEVEKHVTTDLVARIDQLRAELQVAENHKGQLSTARNALRANLSQSRGANQALGAALHEHQILLEEQRGRLASLRALQEAAYGDDQEAIEAFCHNHGIDDLTRLAEYVDIEAGWERALEVALRIPLGAICGQQLIGRIATGSASALAAASVTVIEMSATATAATQGVDPRRLATKVRSRVDLGPLLDNIYVADDLAAASALRTEIPAAALVVLADGTLLGHNWLQRPGRGAQSEGILARERQLAELAARVEMHDEQTANLRAQLAQAQQRQRDTETDEQSTSEQLETLLAETARQRDELSRLEAECQRRQARAADVAAELERLALSHAEQRETIELLRQERVQAEREMNQHADQREALAETRNSVQRELDEVRLRWREVRDQAHGLELNLEQLRARRLTLEEAGQRNAQALAQASQRCAGIETAIAAAVPPRAEMGTALEAALAARLAADHRLTSARQALNALDDTMRQATSTKSAIEQAIAEKQQRLEQARLDQRALEVRQQELMSRFAQTGEEFETVTAALGENDDEAAVQLELESVASRIARLGPINLAAIEEFTQLSERKDYLDKQNADLTEALDTLLEAIRKIDRETRTRFKETFDKVNNGLQAMFPVLFGGGHAYLEMTGDDLLETGVTVMARPPGKRNSNIHLLSGGEKALTALAFVFSIFELNPAPFCLLDEVDAPLDDSNVVRLTEMLQSMAKNVQFIYVTHNKITMEIAEQLIGVTMQEAGVSRLVSVNMEEAVQLAATA